MKDSLATKVKLYERAHYPIYIGKNILENLGLILTKTIPDITQLVVVTSPIINDLHGSNLNKAIKNFNPSTLIVPDGEKAKNWKYLQKLIDEFLNRDLDRKATVVAFGGGAIGDLTGFAASIYLRGIKVVQVPTTLLGMVDSSIGGKTAINHPKGKNLIGTFHQPSLVISDPLFLKTLPLREIRSGMAEVVKHGVIHNTPLFKEIEEKSQKLLKVEPDAFTSIIKRCSLIKAWYVEQDARDSKGLRVALNYGHTTGHAIEILSDHKVTHGESVAMGMDVAARLSTKLNLCEKSVVHKQRNLLRKLGIETSIPDLDPSDIVNIMISDKKTESSNIRMVLPTGIGKPTLLKRISKELIAKVLSERD
jgi:3-dehydroquinate synthase